MGAPMRLAVAMAAGLLVGATSSVAAATLALRGSAFCTDTYIWLGGGAPEAGNPTLIVGNHPDAQYRQFVYRALLRFDLSIIPASSTIRAATVRMVRQPRGLTAAAEVTMHRVLVPWDWQSATGARRSAQEKWAAPLGQPGVDFDPQPESSAKLDQARGPVQWSLRPETVQDWLAHPERNHGVLLKSVAEQADFKYLRSTDYEMDQDRPCLEVTFDAPPGTTVPRIIVPTCRLFGSGYLLAAGARPFADRPAVIQSLPPAMPTMVGYQAAADQQRFVIGLSEPARAFVALQQGSPGTAWTRVGDLVVTGDTPQRYAVYRIDLAAGRHDITFPTAPVLWPGFDAVPAGSALTRLEASVRAVPGQPGRVAVAGIDAASGLAYLRTGQSAGIACSASTGLMGRPVYLEVAGRKLAFDGFYVAIDGSHAWDWTVQSARVEAQGTRLVAHHLLERKATETTVPVDITIASPADGVFTFAIVAGRPGQHLDALGFGDYFGAGTRAREAYFATSLALIGPHKFHVSRPDNAVTRALGFVLDNGVAAIVGSDLFPREITFDPDQGRYDLVTWSGPEVTYTMAVAGETAAGASPHARDVALRRYSDALPLAAPSTLPLLPGRCVFMAPRNQPLTDPSSRWLLADFVARGAREFIYLSYYPVAGDKAIVHRIAPGTLYSYYEQSADTYDSGSQIPQQYWCTNFDPHWMRYAVPGQLARGWKACAQCLPHKYIEWGMIRQQALHHRSNPNDRIFNLAIAKQELGPEAVYVDVHASFRPTEYMDWEGKTYPVRDWQAHTAAYFNYLRDHFEGAPVYSEGGGESYVGSMDAGAFVSYPTADTYGMNADRWAYYPLIEAMHRQRLANFSVGPHGINFGGQWADPVSPLRKRLALCVLTGRSELISCYTPGEDYQDNTWRLFMWWLTTRLNRQLGLSRIRSTDFGDKDPGRTCVHYDNGTTVWVNQREPVWEVEGFRLPHWGYLVRGEGFEQYRALAPGGYVVDSLRSLDEAFVYAPQVHDFGFVKTDGALGFRRQGEGVLVYQVLAPSGPVALVPSHMWAGLPHFASGHVIRLAVDRESAGPLALQSTAASTTFTPIADRSVVRYEFGG